MLDDLIKDIAIRLQNELNFSVSFGLAHTQIIEKNGKILKSPKSINLDPMTCDNIPEKFIFPDSSYNMLTFFKEIKTEVKEKFTGHFIEQNSTLILGCWYNTKRLNTTKTNLISTLINKVLKGVDETDQIKNIEITYNGYSDANPFIGYDMNEEKNQYLMHPYDAFSLVFSFKFLYTWNCIKNITVIDEC